MVNMIYVSCIVYCVAASISGPAPKQAHSPTHDLLDLGLGYHMLPAMFETSA